ncbi:Adenosine 3prime-phospho 5prime-phosphosulfate transporter 2 [Diplonema papillatum]|nr:Adenosine 3prime-phospho 5prime-phosphosulfate transporter 2 [Diplonema papillatum]
MSGVADTLSEDSSGSGKLLLVVLAMFCTWGAHDFLQETVFRFEGFTYGTFMSLCLQSTAVLGAQANSLWNRRFFPKQATPLLEPHPHFSDGAWRVKALYYGSLAVAIAVSNSMSSTALNYVNMPAKVLFKSSKLIPVLILGAILKTETPGALDYACAAVISLGLAVFSFADLNLDAQFSTIGVLILSVAVTSDALAPNLQQVLLKKQHQTKEEVVFYTNWLSSILTLLALAFTNTLIPAITFLSQQPMALFYILCQSIAGYLGIVIFLYSISNYGPCTTVIIASTRKMATIALSFVVYRKPCTPLHIVGAVAVLGAVTVQGYFKRKPAKT